LTDTGKAFAVPSPVCILPFILQPPQPVIYARAATADTFELSISNSLDLLTYQVYQMPALSGGGWNLLTTELAPNPFCAPYSLPQEYFRVGVLTNY